MSASCRNPRLGWGVARVRRLGPDGAVAARACGRDRQPDGHAERDSGTEADGEAAARVLWWQLPSLTASGGWVAGLRLNRDPRGEAHRSPSTRIRSPRRRR